MKKLIPHITIILALMFTVFFIIDMVNSAMNFVGNDISNVLRLLFCASAVITSVIAIQEIRKS
ncbi:MAG: hypothetical protein ACOX17_06560 [Christensenellales bacterium]|jgi:hypothetical protein